MEKKKIYDYRCHRCWKISERLIPWHDDDFNNELKECFARCGIK
ncbi:22350_t:CDS:1, partial [Rhizophagus irregularis]